MKMVRDFAWKRLIYLYLFLSTVSGRDCSSWRWRQMELRRAKGTRKERHLGCSKAVAAAWPPACRAAQFQFEIQLQLTSSCQPRKTPVRAPVLQPLGSRARNWKSRKGGGNWLAANIVPPFRFGARKSSLRNVKAARRSKKAKRRPSKVAQVASSVCQPRALSSKVLKSELATFASFSD